MRRSIAAVTALFVTGVFALGGAAPAFADDVPFPPISVTTFMRGALDSLTVVPGEGIVATGWLFDSRDPGAVAYPGEFQMRYPDGHVGWASGPGTHGLSRPDVAAAYPEAGPNHGFRIALGYPGQAGVYTFCARSYAEVLGCASVALPADAITGTVESLTVDSTTDTPAIRVRGWVADTWASQGNYLTLTVTHTDADPRYNSTTVNDWANASLDRPDIRGSHPGLAGVKGFDERIEATRPGGYTVCVRARSFYQYPGNQPAELGCASATVSVMQKVTDPVITGSATPGSTLTLTPATWSPTPTRSHIWWSNVYWGGSTGREDVLDYPVTNADVGHQISAIQAVSAPGVLGSSAGVSTVTVSLPGVSTERLSGDDRYAVAIANSQSQFPDSVTGAPAVYIASGAKFPDALSAGPAAAAQGAGVLLTLPDRLPDSVRNEIVRLHPATIVVVGGPASVSDAVVTALGSLAPTTRIGGADRFEVSRAVIDFAFPAGAPNAFVATGNTYPDALSAGAAAASTGAPVLLTNGSAASADAPTRAALARLGAKKVTVVGGPASVSDGVAASLGNGIAVTRLAGPDRFTAAIALNRGVFSSADTVYLATGLNFPDGIAVGAHAGAKRAPLYLVDGTCVPQEVIADIVRLGASTVVVLGGTTSMEQQLDDLFACA